MLRTPLDRPDVAKATTLIPEGPQVVTDISGARDALYVTRRDGAVKRLLRVAHAVGPALRPVALPVEGNVRVVDADPRLACAVLALGGWTRATRHHALDAKGNVTDLALAPAGPFDAPEGIEAREVRVKSHDGVEVPVSILLAKGTKLDGRNPLLLYGYGAYGNVPEYGTVTKEEEFRALLAMSPYANVKAGAAYPAVLFGTASTTVASTCGWRPSSHHGSSRTLRAASRCC